MIARYAQEMWHAGMTETVLNVALSKIAIRHTLSGLISEAWQHQFASHSSSSHIRVKIRVSQIEMNVRQKWEIAELGL